ncbi:50S ribosomal protein L21 [Petrotoga sp. 9PW.55.5.1]|uniref:50S ribosomal protein L21 n=1 Tax=Petrotoga sp. 9PW.55.5.1 TaxID=1308979 RepID=UPI000DC438C6|nr:50S ribosomal protein L21 [Petrotoga sp. 9PW.55.5.1]RAO99366.1 50S ribosomal protein L21 [Petrotoga sp. 9PW.55.5.1]
MYAIVDFNGKQYKVEKEQVIYTEKVKDVEPGNEVVLDKVVYINNDQERKSGKPYVEGARVITEVLEHGKDRKIQIIKFQGRKNYKREKGHRQQYTALKIKEIEG